MSGVAEDTRSRTLYEQACRLMPGGVNSPVRAFKGVGGTPIFFERAKGARLYDVDGREYIDYVCSWGAIIVGHAHPTVVEAIGAAAARGTSFGAPHPGEIELAEAILQRMPVLERVRFVNSGSEATMSAIRLARAATGRMKILKFAGNYHGAVDSLLAKAGSGVATLGIPDCAGVTEAAAGDTIVARYNDLESVGALLESARGEVAAILVEPVVGNMGCVPPKPGFLEGLRELATQSGALLIIDEVMTGFRVAGGGACERFGIEPDLVCMGKVIGGGLPVGAYGGRADLMKMIAPEGPVYQAGTLSGNPLAMAAGVATLSLLDTDSYRALEELGRRLAQGLRQACRAKSVEAQVQSCGSMISVFFTGQGVVDFDTADTTNRPLYAKVFHALLERGVYLPPSALESWFLSIAHTAEDIDRTVEQFAQALGEATA